MKIECPICNSDSVKTDIKHLVIDDAPLFYCNNCDYHFIDCLKYSSGDIHKHQSENSMYFGGNLARNDKYLEYLIELRENYKIDSILEIGTPSNYDFLEKVHNEFKHDIQIYAYDIIHNDFPDYINFSTNIHEIESTNIDALFCLHTLEHIPTNELRSFANMCRRISKYFIFEIPYCKEEEIIIESTKHPHYSFFTERSIKQLFGEDINIEIPSNRILKFNNLS